MKTSSRSSCELHSLEILQKKSTLRVRYMMHDAWWLMIELGKFCRLVLITHYILDQEPTDITSDEVGRWSAVGCSCYNIRLDFNRPRVDVGTVYSFQLVLESYMFRILRNPEQGGNHASTLNIRVLVPAIITYFRQHVHTRYRAQIPEDWGYSCWSSGLPYRNWQQLTGKPVSNLSVEDQQLLCCKIRQETLTLPDLVPVSCAKLTSETAVCTRDGVTEAGFMVLRSRMRARSFSLYNYLSP